MKLPFAKNRRTLTLLAVLVPILLLFVWVVLQSGPLAPVEVTVMRVEERAISPVLFGIGTVEARYTQEIGPTAPGRVTRLTVDVGDHVQPGQLLAELDPVDLDQRIAAAGGTIARAAALEQSASAQIVDASARVSLARTQADRVEALSRDGWVTQAMVDQRRQELAAAHANLAATRANRNAATQDRERVRSERAALIEQRANLRLVAPNAGLVVRRAVEPGTTVVAGQSVVEIVDPTQFWINTRFDQTQSAGIASGLEARIALRSRPDQLLGGSVLRVEPLADAITEEILAKIAFRPRGNLPPIGELAEVTVILPARPRSLAVPNAAVHQLDDENGVWAIRDGDPVFVPVTLGSEDVDGWVQILDGLSEGEQIVVHSAAQLGRNSRISVVDRLP